MESSLKLSYLLLGIYLTFNFLNGNAMDYTYTFSTKFSLARALIFFFLILLLFSCNRQSPLTEEEVINAIRKFDYGWEHKNLKSVDSILSPAYIYFTQSGSTFSRDSVVATAGENSYLLHDMSRSEFVVTIYDNTAVVSTRWKGKGTYRGTAFDEDQRCSVVLVKKNDKVEILSEHCTPVKPNHIFH